MNSKCKGAKIGYTNQNAIWCMPKAIQEEAIIIGRLYHTASCGNGGTGAKLYVIQKMKNKKEE